ncbi:MAG: hypothetical protein ACRDY2_03585, partial [Acidimicrobiales bacterium]
LAAQPSSGSCTSAGAVSLQSLQADLHAYQQRCVAFAARVRQLEDRLSGLLGTQTWQNSGLGAPDDIDHLQRQVARLEAQVADVRLQLEERTDELNAARLANRELITHLNSSRGTD